jgi:D-arabinose 1-dehydrogenase-like Zn-dependent alcohol dehydrogenase
MVFLYLRYQSYNIMTSRFVQVSKPGGPLEIVERDIPEPGPAQVRIKVQACGICHGDSVTKEGLFPGIQYPRVLGHEVAGVIDAVGLVVSVGMVAIVDIANLVGVEISSHAAMHK